MSDNQLDQLAQLARAFEEEHSSDLFLYSGEIAEAGTQRLLQYLYGRPQRHAVASIFLTSFGGDPAAAYRMMRVLQRCYERIRLLIAGPCKSAGTLMAIGADELVFGPQGELGPLDTQMVKQDDLVLTSGLDTIQGLESLTHQVFIGFEKYLLAITNKSGGAISTRTASEIASQLVTGIFQPIAAQIDPHRLGEIERAMSVALAYGDRLRRQNITYEALVQLVHAYPAHGFVIDAEEAEKLFANVHELSESEYNLLSVLGNVALAPAYDVTVLDFCQFLQERSDEPVQEPEQAASPSTGHEPPASEPDGQLSGDGHRGDPQDATRAAKTPLEGGGRRNDSPHPGAAAEGGGSPGETEEPPLH